MEPLYICTCSRTYITLAPMLHCDVPYYTHLDLASISGLAHKPTCHSTFFSSAFPRPVPVLDAPSTTCFSFSNSKISFGPSPLPSS